MEGESSRAHTKSLIFDTLHSVIATHGPITPNVLTIAAERVLEELTGEKTHNYKIVNSTYHTTIEESANYWAEHGWRVVGVIKEGRPGYATRLVLERPVGITHPDD